jgi:putative ABC transport system substrate-binding protein
MKKTIAALALCALLFGFRFPAEAQQSGKLPHVGFLHGGSKSTRLPHIEAFRQGLRERGYVEGTNITVEYRFAEGKLDQLPDLAAELVKLNVNVIAAATTAAMRAAKRATTTIPIVMVGSSDPVGAGLVASLARPGGNVTGLSFLGAELSGKQLELLKEAVPNASRVAVLVGGGANQASPVAKKETEVAARGLGVRLQTLEVSTPKEFDAAFSAMTKGRAHALTILTGPLFDVHLKAVADLAATNWLPAIYGFRDFPHAGGLMSYGTDMLNIYTRAATYVDKILKDTKPGDIPVEQPLKFDLVINLKTAKQIGMTIPPNVLARADKVIK